MRRFHHERGTSLGWLPGAWVLVGGQLLCGLWFWCLGPPPPFGHRFTPAYHLDNAEVLYHLARVTALANLFVVVAVWLKYRSYRLKSVRSRVRRIACLATALSLVLAPVLYAQLAHGWALPPLVLENVWQHGEAGFYHEGVLAPVAQEPLAEWRASIDARADDSR
ncbi:MAG: hypothetical protein GY719_06365 [bacterium]|nr:hypothetical protein [bacterium]